MSLLSPYPVLRKFTYINNATFLMEIERKATSKYFINEKSTALLHTIV